VERRFAHQKEMADLLDQAPAEKLVAFKKMEMKMSAGWLERLREGKLCAPGSGLELIPDYADVDDIKVGDMVGDWWRTRDSSDGDIMCVYIIGVVVSVNGGSVTVKYSDGEGETMGIIDAR
jgi:hypothetical protein